MMRTLKGILTVVTGILIAGSAVAQEWDDMYFTKSDRKTRFTNSQYNQSSSFAEEADGPVRIDDEDQLASDSYSARVINPDYIAKYKSEALDENADAEAEESTYYDANYATASQNNSTYARTYNNYDPWRSSFYNNPWMYGNSWNYYNRLAWGGSLWNSWGPTWGYNPYRFNYNSWNDPYWGPGWGNYYGNRWSVGLSYSWGWGSPYYNSVWGPSYYGGFGGGGLYCPPGYYGGGFYGRPVVINNNNYYDNNGNARNITYGPRTARNTTAVGANNTGRTRNSRNSAPDLTPVDGSNATGRTAAVNPQGNYYRRSRTTEAGNVRTSQRSTRNTAVTTGQSLNESRRNAYNYSRSGRTSSATTNYTRSRTVRNNPAVPTYSNTRSNSTIRSNSNRPRSAATRTSSFNRSNSNSRSSGTYRSNSGRSYQRSTPSRSSYSTGSRSRSSSYSSGSRSRSSYSAPSRSSGRSSSGGGASRSSSGGGRRGGN